MRWSQSAARRCDCPAERAGCRHRAGNRTDPGQPAGGGAGSAGLPLVTGLEAWLDFLDTLSSALSLIVVSGLLLIVGNIVGSSVQSRREEIRIIKQIGGTDAYVRRPFVYFGGFLGAAGGTLACLFTAAIGHQLAMAVDALALHYQTVQTVFAVAGLSFGQNLTIILLGASIGGLAVFLCSRKIATFNP